MILVFSSMHVRSGALTKWSDAGRPVLPLSASLYNKRDSVQQNNPEVLCGCGVTSTEESHFSELSTTGRTTYIPCECFDCLEYENCKSVRYKSAHII
jgi:hypothetical protein